MLNFLSIPNAASGILSGGGIPVADTVVALLESVMEEEASALADHIRRLHGPVAAYRNGYRIRRLKTQYGDLTLHVPQFRSVPFRTRVFSPYRRMSRELEDLVSAAVHGGISTRKVDALAKTLGISGISASTVSRICARYDERVRMFLSRPLIDAVPYVWADATYVSVRNSGRYVRRPLMIAVGVNARGERTILGAKLAFRESEESWLLFFRDLAARGLSGVRLVVTDLRCGIRSAVSQAFGGASWQVCNMHLLRSVAGQMQKEDVRKIAKEFSLMMHTGSSGYDGLITALQALGYGDAVSLLCAYREDALAYRTFPRAHWKALYTTNPIENINSVLKRRIRIAGSFPSDAAAMRMAGTLLMRLERVVFSGKVYLRDMDAVVTEEEEADAVVEDDNLYEYATFESYPSRELRIWSQIFS